MIAGTMAVTGTFPQWETNLAELCLLTDAVYVRIDARIAPQTTHAKATAIMKSKYGRIMHSTTPWDEWHWREELLRMLDDVHPAIVLNCDEDEAFGVGLMHDIERLRVSGPAQMAFEYAWPPPTIDRWKPRRTKPYPSKPHVKAFRWSPGLTFRKYKGRGRLSNYSKSDVILAQSKILHFCFYTPELREKKKGLLTTAGKQQWARKAARR